MKIILTILSLSLFFLPTAMFAQNGYKQHKVGHTFHITLPEYMVKTVGLNDVASIQYKSVVKDVYGFVIVDTKEELGLIDMKYSSVKEFYDSFMSDFVKEDEQSVISKPVEQKKGDIQFIECDAVFIDPETKEEMYYLIGIVETKMSYYKVLSWTTQQNKNKFKADFQKILYSIKD